MITPRLMTAFLSTLVASIVLGTISPAAAQTAPPTFELSAGYQFTHVPDRELPLGFAIDAARNWGTFGLLAEGGWARDSESESGLEPKFTMWHIGAGGRWSGRRNPRVTPYGQIIAGWLQGPISDEISSNHFMVQPGGGVSFQAGDGWAVVVAADYRRALVGDNDDDGDDDDAEDGSSRENHFRVLFGFRMILD